LKKLQLILSWALFPILCHAQVLVDETYSAEYLVNEVLLGGGVVAENITLNGISGNQLNEQIGYFTAEGSNIGISQGIILASGGVSVAESPNDLPTAHVAISEDAELENESDLEQIVWPAELNDVAVLEFDFTAEGDTLRFKYVFASEEYNEHTCSPYNDVFGFFISGPGIDGNPNYENNAKNVALVPGTNVPVAINTVNQGFAGAYGSENVCNLASSNWQNNSQYFIDNENNGDPSAPQFDGFTVPFIIEIPVECGGTYHIKLAIADAVDDKNDSAVFIEAGSFESEPPLEASVQIANPSANGEALEGCSQLELDLSRPDSIGSKTIYLNVLGLQNKEEVIPNLPDSIRFSHLDGTKSLSFDILHDGQYEGLREVEIQFLQTEVCSADTTVISRFFDLTDFENLNISAPDTLMLDCIEPALIDIDVTGGNAPYEIVWTDPDIEGFDFELNPVENIELTGIVSDGCNIHQENISIQIIRQEYEDLQVFLPEEVGFNCVDPVSITPIIEGGFGDYSYQWEQDGVIISESLVFNEVVESPGNLTFSVEDRCAPSASANIQLNSLINPIQVSLDDDTTGNCTELMTIIPNVSGGFGELTFLWKKNGNEISSNSTFGFTPSETTLLELTVKDQCEQEASDEQIVYLYNEPLRTDLPSDTAICMGERIRMHPEPYGGYGDYSISWNGQEIEELSIIPDRNETHVVKIEDECGTITEHPIEIRVEHVNADFEFLYSDPFNTLVNHSTSHCQYQWQFPDGSYSEEYEPILSEDLLRQGQTVLFVINELGCFDEISKPFRPPFSVYLPTAFTPDGDGLNDVFKAETEYVASFELSIYDRWGNLVFQSNDVDSGWNGDTSDGRLTSGENIIYNYIYKAVSWNGDVKQGRGVVTLLR